MTASSSAGIYYYGACVDAVADESDTTNNCSSAVQVAVEATMTEPRGHPDLAVTAPSVTDSTPAAGAPFTLSATVSNSGAADAAATTLRYYRSTDATVTTSDTEVGTDPIAALGAAGSSSRSVDLTAPASPGTYYYGACVDAVTDESDSTNNCSTAVQVTVPQPTHPDLTVTAPSVSDSTPATGAAFALSATVSNAGAADAAATTLRYYRSTDATIATTDTEVGTTAIAALGAAGSSSRSVDLTAPASPGTYYYGACVDAVTDESDTTNNCSSAVRVAVEVTVAEPQGHPELVVMAPSVTDSSPAAGAAFTLSATVRNAGEGDAEATTLRYYRSADAIITTSDTEVGTDAIAALGATGGNSQSVDLTAPASPGTYYYGACVDAVTDESDSTNNCSTAVQVTVPVTVPVPAPQPDLVAGSPSVNPSNPAAGTAFTLSATVSNTGDGEAAATTVRYYQSADATVTASDTEVGTQAVAGLPASVGIAQPLSLTAPETAGTYYYGACVDAVTNESDTTNNCSAAVQVTVTQQPRSLPQQQVSPDLEVASPSVTANTPAAGASFTLSATVSNTGDGEAAATTLRYYRSTDATITTSDTEVGTDAITKLGAAGSSSQSVDLTAPATAATYYYGACVDAVTGESDTTNNCSSAVQVEVQAAVQEPKPDLLVSNLRVDLKNPVTGERFTLSAEVLNRTRGASAATTLRYYRSTDSTITTSDTQVGTDAVGALPAYGSSAESISLTAPATTGAYYYGACVEAVAGESNTTNNCSVSVKVDVMAQQKRVDISPRTLTFEAVGHSGTVTVRILDENGDEDTDASYDWISISGAGGPCCTLTKVNDGLKVTMTRAGNMRVDLSSTGAKSATLHVTAYQKATSLEVSPASVSLEVDETATLSATVKDANGHAIAGRTVYWTTSDAEVATVEGADAGGETGATATVTGAAAGTATITARHAVTITGTATATVTEDE